MQTALACDALKNCVCLLIKYDGFTRLVEVHAVGFSTENHALMRVWQVQGGSKTKETGWKLLRLDEALALDLTKEKSYAPRQGYRKNDKDMARIICQI